MDLLSFSSKIFMNLRNVPLNEKGNAYYNRLESMLLLPEVKRVSSKSAEKALEYRNLGNKCFLSGEFDEAHKYYTKSVSVAPPTSSELAFAFANRSAALFRLKKFKASIVDINRALKENYPENSKQKLHDRKEKCVSSLRNPESNAVEFSDMLERSVYGADDGENPEKFDINSTNMNYDDKFCPPEVNFNNHAIPCASEKVALKYSSSFGRHVVAVSDIKPGEYIAVEKPISSMLYWNFKYSHCANCFLRCESLIPCPNCSEVLFCSKRCFDDALDRFHRIECQIVSLSGYPVLESLDWRAIRLLMSVTKQGKELESLMTHPVYKYPFKIAPEKLPDVLDSQDYGNIHNLDDHHDKKSEHSMWEAIHMAALIIHMLKHTTFFEEQQKKKKSLKAKVKYLGALLPKLILLNPNTCDVIEWLNLKKMVLIAPAFYSFHSLINHSCDDNVFKTYHKDIVATVAISFIKAGEQIFENYGMWYESDILNTRQKFLLEHYHFKCHCVACENDWPSLMSFGFPSAKAQIMKSAELKRYAKAMENKSYTFEMLCEYLALLQEKTKRPNWEFHECQQELTRMLVPRGNSYFLTIEDYMALPYVKDNITKI